MIGGTAGGLVDVVAQAVDDVATLFFGVDEAGAFEDAQVVGDVG